MKRVRTDILILGSGGAGLFAALHAKQAAPGLDVTIAVKGLLGKCGCTRMVQGGYNVAIAAGDSVERHFMDTIEGGQWLNDQELAWTLVTVAQTRIRELENELGCFFDRNPDGTVHQKAFAGQTFDRTVHKGDLTGIEIVNRLAEQVWALDVKRLEEYRAIDLVRSRDGERIAGVVMIDMRTGGFVFVQARAVLLATGGGPTMYRYHTPSGDKSCDGMAMALRAGLTLRDMEMVQFHPTGLLAGPDTRMTGTVLEEGLRGAGGYLLDGAGERFMLAYDPRGERATRDIVSRAMFDQIRQGRTTPLGGLYIEMKHLDPVRVRREFKGMVERCADCGFDLAGGRVEVIPTAHYMMGGLEFRADGATALAGLYAAGEDTGGVHGANRLGGNGVANSTVFGGIAGETMAAVVGAGVPWPEPDETAIAAAVDRARRPIGAKPDPDALLAIRERLWDVMWHDVGIIRDADGLARAAGALDEIDGALDRLKVAGEGDLAFNLTWHDWLNLKSLVLTSRAIRASAAARRDSCGSHYRGDFPDAADPKQAAYTRIALADGSFTTGMGQVAFTRVKPGESLLGRVLSNRAENTAHRPLIGGNAPMQTLSLLPFVHENMATAMTFAFSQERIRQIIEEKFCGRWPYLEKFCFDLPERNATRACLEVALLIRSLDDQKKIAKDFATIDQGKPRSFGVIHGTDDAQTPLLLRDLPNKIIHAGQLEWDFTEAGAPKLVCWSLKDHQDKNPWIKAEIDIVALAGFCGQIAS
jgi:fumarate reductase flavoprotein subunit